MSASTEVVPDLDAATVEQLQPPCEGGTGTWFLGMCTSWVPCPLPAAWVIRYRCGCTDEGAMLECDEHASLANRLTGFHFVCQTQLTLVSMERL
jgi:hypothetical protein